MLETGDLAYSQRRAESRCRSARLRRAAIVIQLAIGGLACNQADSAKTAANGGAAMYETDDNWRIAHADFSFDIELIGERPIHRGSLSTAAGGRIGELPATFGWECELGPRNTEHHKKFISQAVICYRGKDQRVSTVAICSFTNANHDETRLYIDQADKHLNIGARCTVGN